MVEQEHEQPPRRGRGPGRRNRTAALEGRAPLLAMPGIDGRQLWPRLQNKTFSEVINHCGGDQAVSDLERIAARRIATFEAELLFLERKFSELRAAGKSPTLSDLDLYGRLSGHQHRLSAAIGLSRRARDVTPDLDAYLKATAHVRSTVENAVYDAVTDASPIAYAAHGEGEQLDLVEHAADLATAHDGPPEPAEGASE